MSTLTELTSVFEGIASMRIAQIKNQVLQATQFFQELWNIYSQLRVDGLFRFGRSQTEVEVSQKELYILTTIFPNCSLFFIRSNANTASLKSNVLSMNGIIL